MKTSYSTTTLPPASQLFSTTMCRKYTPLGTALMSMRKMEHKPMDEEPVA